MTELSNVLASQLTRKQRHRMEDEFFSQYNQDVYRQSRHTSLSSVGAASGVRTARAHSLGLSQFPVRTATPPPVAPAAAFPTPSPVPATAAAAAFPAPRVVTVAPTFYRAVPTAPLAMAPTYRAPVTVSTSLPVAPSLYNRTALFPPASAAPTLYSANAFPVPTPTTTTTTTTSYRVFPPTPAYTHSTYSPLLPATTTTTYSFGSPPVTFPNTQFAGAYPPSSGRPLPTAQRTYQPPVYGSTLGSGGFPQTQPALVRFVPQYGLD
eukprot:EG_transcript_12353